jgi:ribonuclease Z
MKLVFLGTGGSYPSKERNVPCTALKMNGDIVLFDVGEGTQRQMMHSTLSFMQISHILISHFHGDHFLGLPGLIQTMYMNDRKAPLTILGPPGTERRITALLGLGHFDLTYELSIKDMEDGGVIDCGHFTISAREVDHSVRTLGFAVEEKPRPGRFNKPKALEMGIPEGPMFRRLQKGETIVVNGLTITPDMVMGPTRRGRKIVYSGDTRPCQAIRDLAKGADILIHEATGMSDIGDKMAEHGHATAKEAAEAAKASDVKMLFLTHLSPRYKETGPLEAEAKAIFPETRVASDLMEFEVPFPPDDETAA